MFLQYGQYPHALNEARMSLSRTGLFVNGMSRGYNEAWHVSGMFFGANATALTSGMATMKAAYAVQSQDIGFFNDDSSPTAMLLLSSTCRGGTRVIQPPSFQKLDGAEYTSYVSYQLAVEGEVFDPNNAVISWRESLSFSGGGPAVVWLETLNTQPQPQITKQYTTYRATQSGSATGLYSYPIVPSPLWPQFEIQNQRNVSETGPERSGPINQAFLSDFGVSWSYQFASAIPFTGQPTLPPN
jgi:hypothetical protein